LNEWIVAWGKPSIEFSGFHYFVSLEDADAWYQEISRDILAAKRKFWWLKYGKLGIVKGEFAGIVAAGGKDKLRIGVATYWRPTEDIVSSYNPPIVTEETSGLIVVKDGNSNSITTTYREYWNNGVYCD